MILASQNAQIAEEKDFVREKISGIFFCQHASKQKSTARAVLFCLEMKRADAHEKWSRASPNEAWLCHTEK